MIKKALLITLAALSVLGAMNIVTPARGYAAKTPAACQHLTPNSPAPDIAGCQQEIQRAQPKQATGSGACSSYNAQNGLCADCLNGGNGGVNCSKGTGADCAAGGAGNNCDPNAKCTKDSCDLIKKYVNPLINLLSIVFGLIATISIILGGIQYSTSAGDPQAVTKAKRRITLTIFAIVSYFFLFAFLQFLIPGGIFNR